MKKKKYGFDMCMVPAVLLLGMGSVLCRGLSGFPLAIFTFLLWDSRDSVSLPAVRSSLVLSYPLSERCVSM